MLSAISIPLARLLRGLSKRELAQRTGLSYTLIAAIECGDRRLTERSSRRIREALALDDETVIRIIELQAGAGRA